MKEWSSTNKKDIFTHIPNLESKLDSLDKNNGPASSRWSIFYELQRAFAVRDSILKQKSRLKWETDGNTNSRFYLQLIKYKQNKSHIHGIWVNNAWISKPKEIKDHFLQHFINLFSQNLI